MKNYYIVLGLEPQADDDSIKVAYHKLSKKFHPDLNGGDAFFTKRFQDIQEAYEVLASPAKRAQYDSQLAAVSGCKASAATQTKTPTNPEGDPIFEAKLEAYRRANQAFRQQQNAALQAQQTTPQTAQQTSPQTHKPLPHKKALLAVASAIGLTFIAFPALPSPYRSFILGFFADSIGIGAILGATAIACAYLWMKHYRS